MVNSKALHEYLSSASGTDIPGNQNREDNLDFKILMNSITDLAQYYLHTYYFCTLASLFSK